MIPSNISLLSLTLVFCFVVKTICFKSSVRLGNSRLSRIIDPNEAYETNFQRVFGTRSSDDDLLIDESKLSPEEKERLVWIKKLSTEADEIVRKAGFMIEGADEVFKEVEDTNWSGQSTVEKTMSTSNTWGDLIVRWPLTLGDISSLILFAAIGRNNHGENLNIAEILGTASPFIFAWLFVSPILGAYSVNSTATKGKIFTGLLPGWAISLPLALSIRGYLKGEIPPVPFVIVSLVSTLVLLSVWRYLYVVLFGESSSGEYRQGGLFEVFKMMGTLIKRW